MNWAGRPEETGSPFASSYVIRSSGLKRFSSSVRRPKNALGAFLPKEFIRCVDAFRGYLGRGGLVCLTLDIRRRRAPTPSVVLLDASPRRECLGTVKRSRSEDASSVKNSALIAPGFFAELITKTEVSERRGRRG